MIRINERLKYVIAIIIFVVIVVSMNFSLAVENTIKTKIECNKAQIISNEEIELTFKLQTSPQIKEYINVYKAKIEYDKNVFTEVTNSNFTPCNTWASLKYNSKNGEFVIVNFNNISEVEDVVKIKLKIKNNIQDISKTNIKISNMETGNWNDKKDIKLSTIDGKNEQNILLNIIKQGVNIGNKEDNKQEVNIGNKGDNKQEVNIGNKGDNKQEVNIGNKGDNKQQVNIQNKSKQLQIQREINDKKTGTIPKLGDSNIIVPILLIILVVTMIITMLKMKKIKYKTFTIILALVAFTTMSFSINVKATVKLGDINNNGKIDINDIEMLEEHLINSAVIKNTGIVDMNEDGKLSISDLSILVHGLKENKDENTDLDNTTNNDNKDNDDKDNPTLEEKNTKTAQEAIKEMKIGWNLGNTLDSCNYQKKYIGEQKAITYYETIWGNPETTKEMIDEIKKAGFESVRLPVTYYDHINQDGIIDEKWFDRVKEIVSYILDNDMYCILDVHHDTGLYTGGSWIVADSDRYEENAKKLSDLWTQIAEEFKDYSYKLVFEGFNEIVDTNKNYDWVSGYTHTVNVNKLSQVFVDTVRKTGGKNKDRFLAVTTFGGLTDEQKLSTFKMPKDEAENKIILALHDYAYQEKVIDNLFARIKKYCTDKNIPVILDEFGTMKTTLKTEEQRAKAAEYYITKAKEIGVTCFWWDNGNSNEYMIFNRRNLTWEYIKIKDAIVNNSK